MEDYYMKAREHAQNFTILCPFRIGGNVECDALTKCESCGWHPDTERRRLRQEYRKRNIPIPGDSMIRLKRCP